MVHLRLEGAIAQFRPHSVLSVPLVLLLHVAEVLNASVVYASLLLTALDVGLALASGQTGIGLLVLPEDYDMLLLRAEQLEELQRGIQELHASEAYVHLDHFVEDWREGLELTCFEGRKTEVDIKAGEFLVGRRGQLSEDFINPLFLHMRNQIVRMLQGLYFCPLFLHLWLGFLHSLVVKILSNGELFSVAVLWSSACVRKTGVGGVRAAHLKLLLMLFLTLQVGNGLFALHDLAGYLVDGGFEGHFHEVVLPFFFLLLLELPVVVVEPLEALALALLPEVGETALADLSVHLLAYCVDLGPKRALFHHFFFFQLFFPQQGRMLFFGPSVSLFDDVFLAQFSAYFLADAVDLGLILLILHQIIFSGRVLLVLVMIPQDPLCSFLFALPRSGLVDAAGGIGVVFAQQHFPCVDVAVNFGQGLYLF